MIRIQNVSKSFEDFQALKDLDLHVKKGSIYGLVGVNGSGKTTLIKHLTGVFRPDKGDILIDGQPVFDNISIKERIGYISDDLFFFAMYNLKDSSRFYSKLYPRWNQERYRHMLQQFGLSEKKRLSRFSKGMQKQAAFILAMSSMPDVLVLDEPIDGLDPIVRKKVMKYIVEDVSERDMTVLVSSHNLKEMEGICDSIGILNQGRMVIERDLDELKSGISKVQAVFPREAGQEPWKGLNVLFHEKRGSVDLLIIKGETQQVEAALLKAKPVIMDLLPLTLEEIFIYEMGGDNDELKEILF